MTCSPKMDKKLQVSSVISWTETKYNRSVLAWEANNAWRAAPCSARLTWRTMPTCQNQEGIFMNLVDLEGFAQFLYLKTTVAKAHWCCGKTCKKRCTAFFCTQPTVWHSPWRITIPKGKQHSNCHVSGSILVLAGANISSGIMSSGYCKHIFSCFCQRDSIIHVYSNTLWYMHLWTVYHGLSR